MAWNIAPECISIVFLCIIWVYSHKGNLIPNLKNKLFQVSFVVTFCGIGTNILSTLLIYNLNESTLLLTWVVTLVYFAATPLMGMVYFFYAIANIYEGQQNIRRYFLFAAIPGAIYLLVLALNPITHSIFNITMKDGYVQGSLISTTYIVFYLYCVICVVLVAVQGKRVPLTVRAILFTFPIIAGIVVVIQQRYPSTILSGSAATSAMLIIYLYLQNKQISIDYLTHLPNRHEFLKMLDIYLRKRYEFSVIVLSLREFKDINDIHGQHNGDALLVALSAYLRKDMGLREGEIYRYSGDEFALLLRVNDADTMRGIVMRLLDRMLKPWSVSGCTCFLLGAIGIVNCPKTAGDTAGLVNGLEYAVSLAKKDAENFNVCYCTPELLETCKRRQIIVEELEKNLREGSFVLHYQPILSVEHQRYVKAEALLRMTSSRLEHVFPDEFIPIAEESGLIIEITYLVLDKVCRFLRHIMDEGIALDSINVNFSALQFSQSDLLPRMLAIMDQYEVPYNKIKVELTESTLAKNAEAITSYLCKMNDLGILIGLDDFGTGYSNLVSVLNLPIETVKFDKSLVWSAVKNERVSITVQNFARAFRDLGMKVLAEGVETQEQSQFVIDAGCAYIQGFLYAKPMPEEAFEAFLKSEAAKNSAGNKTK